MGSKGRFNHPISLNQEQEDLVNKARQICEVSYSELVMEGARNIIKRDEIKKKSNIK